MLALLVLVHLQWAYDGMPPGMEVWELTPGQHELWKTEAVPEFPQVPALSRFESAVVPVPARSSRRVALVYHNTSGSPLRFFAAPHHVEPLQGSLGFKFKCLCTNHVYTVPPGYWWYRIVEIRLAPEFSGDRMEVEHHLVRLP